MNEQRIIRIMSGEDQDLTSKAMRCLMRSIEPIYTFAVNHRNKRFDHGIRKAMPLGRPTISVGNITTGGTGKTPFVTMVAEFLLSQGYQPAILLRGYQSDEHGSDEARAYQTLLQDRVIVQTNPSRIAGAAQVLKTNPEVDVFLLDDGFQHRQAARDLDLVLIDATQPFGYDHVLPRGLLREPIENLKRSDAIVLTRCDQVNDSVIKQLQNRIQSLTGKNPIALTAHSWTHLLDTNNQYIDLKSISNQSIAAATGIGNPTAFHKTIKEHTKKVILFESFPDHYHFTNQDITRLLEEASKKNADAFLVTEKDYVKWQTILTDPHKTIMPILRPQLSIQCMEGKDQLFSFIKSTCKPND